MTIAIATIIRRHNTTYKKVELLLCLFILLLLLFLYFPHDHPSLLLIFKVTHTFIQQYYYIFNMAVKRKARINEWTMNYRSGGRGCWRLRYMECPCFHDKTCNYLFTHSCSCRTWPKRHPFIFQPSVKITENKGKKQSFGREYKDTRRKRVTLI